MMNEVPVDQVVEECGEGSLQEHFVPLLDFYRTNDPQKSIPTDFQKIRYRFAPSIITRSECEVLGLPAPRFAFRTWGKNIDSIGFVNLRRIQNTIQALAELKTPEVSEISEILVQSLLISLRKNI